MASLKPLSTKRSDKLSAKLKRALLPSLLGASLMFGSVATEPACALVSSGGRVGASSFRAPTSSYSYRAPTPISSYRSTARSSGGSSYRYSPPPSFNIYSYNNNIESHPTPYASQETSSLSSDRQAKGQLVFESGVVWVAILFFGLLIRIEAPSASSSEEEDKFYFVYIVTEKAASLCFWAFAFLYFF